MKWHYKLVELSTEDQQLFDWVLLEEVEMQAWYCIVVGFLGNEELICLQ